MSALVAAAVVAFLGVATFVGFNGLPFAADDGSEATVNLAAGAPEAAATAAAPTAAAVSATPAAPSAAAAAEILAALPPGAPLPDIPGLAPPGTGPGGGTTTPGVVVVPPGAGVPGAPAAPGTVDNAVSGLEDTAAGLGLDLPLGDLTGPLTGPVDKAVNDTLNNVGGLLGNPKLGDQLSGTLSQTSNGLLGTGGLLNR